MDSRIKKYRYSEIFGNTIQGEGNFTGVPTVWVRFWGCNFKCQGFFQPGKNRDEWIDPYKDVDPLAYKTMEDLPVFEVGCDSAYSWDPRFQHLAHQDTAEAIAGKLENWLVSPTNPHGAFLHAKSKQWTHMAFTGGEPMMNQSAIVDIMKEFDRRKNSPKFITIETNGTQEIREPFIQYWNGLTKPWYKTDTDITQVPTGRTVLEQDASRELFWSVSPKLSASGEPWEKAIRPEVVSQYARLGSKGQLKYVVDGTDEVWDEVEKATALYRAEGVDWPCWIMAVGSTQEEQESIQAAVCEETVSRGYNFSARVHSWIFQNIIGK